MCGGGSLLPDQVEDPSEVNATEQELWMITPNTSFTLLSKGKAVGPPVKSKMTFKYQYPKAINHKAMQLWRTQRILDTKLPKSYKMKENKENCCNVTG